MKFLIGIALCAATALCAVTLPGCVSVNGGSKPMGSIIGQADLPEPGQWCRATYPEQRSGLSISQSQVTGRVAAVDEEGIHLADVQGRQMLTAAAGFDRLPYLGRFLKNTGVGKEHDQVVNPAELESLEIVSEAEVRGEVPQSIARQLTAAVPGPQRIARR